MKKRILNHTCIMVIATVILTFIAAGGVMYGRYNAYMRQSVRDEAGYLQTGIEEFGERYLTEKVGNISSSRITLTDGDGNVLFDSEAEEENMENHADRPEFIEAKETGTGEELRYSETLSEQTFYYALRLQDGRILRVARITDTVFSALTSSFALLGLLMGLILLAGVVLVQRHTEKLIRPINELDLEHPLDNICYEELRPLLKRVDQQNRQIVRQVEELKEAEAVRREFSANVSHELKTPLMSISGYAELMMNGMVPQDRIREFSGRIYHEATRLGSLVTDIIQLSRLDEKDSQMPFESVDAYELARDVAVDLRPLAEKKQIELSVSGESARIWGVRHVLYEMFFNIADNAVRYTEPGGRAGIFVGNRNGKVFYRVEDTGIGIPKAQQGRVFERFYRVDKSHSRQTGGTGLGLSIVKHGASLHRAKIFLDSTPGAGTKMELLFEKNSCCE